MPIHRSFRMITVLALALPAVASAQDRFMVHTMLVPTEVGCATKPYMHGKYLIDRVHHDASSDSKTFEDAAKGSYKPTPMMYHRTIPSGPWYMGLVEVQGTCGLSGNTSGRKQIVSYRIFFGKSEEEVRAKASSELKDPKYYGPHEVKLIDYAAAIRDLMQGKQAVPVSFGKP